MLLDLDRFQVVNDNWGHGVGDELLVAVAQRLTAQLPDLLVVRTGGDEFIVTGRLAPDDLMGERLSARVMATFEPVFELSAGQLVVTTSAGVTTLRPTGRGQDRPEETLLRDADTAMYRAKALGGDRCVRFETEMHAEIAEHVAIEQRLRRAVAVGGFELHYQPIVNLVDGTVRGYEALLRLRPDGGSPLRPDEFIPVAEKTGLILPIGRYVLDEACRQVAAWRSRSRGRDEPGVRRGQRLLAAAARARLRRRRPGRPRTARRTGALPAHRDHRESAHGGRRGRDRDARRPACARHPHQRGRLRDRTLLARLPQAAAGWHGQGRPIVRLRPRRPGRGRGHRATRRSCGPSWAWPRRSTSTVVAEGVETAAQRDALLALGCTLRAGLVLRSPDAAGRRAAAWNGRRRPAAVAG